MKVIDLISVLKLTSPDAEIDISIDGTDYQKGYEKGLAVGRSEVLASVDDLSEDDIITIEALELAYMEKVLRLCKYNRRRASELLGVSERTFYRKLKDMEL